MGVVLEEVDPSILEVVVSCLEEGLADPVAVILVVEVDPG